jgi:leader peptidase (prepilin peptidase)/N-methyltransferase
MDVSPLFRDALVSPLWETSALLFGLVVGSFANVAIHRIPLGESVVTPRSRCPSCRALIRAGDNVPVLSWLVLGRRCRNCRAPISWRYPAVEAANGLLYLGIALRWGPSLAALVAMAFVTALLLLASGLLGGWPRLLLNALAALTAYLGFAALWYAFKRLRNVDALGQGDWKLVAMLGAFMGGERLLLTIFLSSLAGSVLGGAFILLTRRSFRHQLPFGTYLCLIGIAVLFAGDPLIAWYKGLLS